MKLQVIPFKQEGTKMYVGTMTARELIEKAKVDVWEEEDGEQKGYQRAPEPVRYKKIAKYLQREPKPLMPTSILLSYRGAFDVEEVGDGTCIITIPENECLWNVDGQHREYGLREAIEELGIERLNDYQVPFVIAEFPSVEEEAHQFQVINETMKKVRTDLARRLLALRVEQTPAGRISVLEAGRLWEAKAVAIIKMLQNEEDSPWFGRIQRPNEKKLSRHLVKELSFSTSLKSILTTYPFDSKNTEIVGKHLLRYWKAWQKLAPEAFEEPGNYVIQKTPGVFSLHPLFRNVFDILRREGIENPSEVDFVRIIKRLDEFATSEYWESANNEGAAMAGSMKGFKILADGFAEKLEDEFSTN